MWEGERAKLATVFASPFSASSKKGVVDELLYSQVVLLYFTAVPPLVSPFTVIS
jgi:hypothetical protein